MKSKYDGNVPCFDVELYVNHIAKYSGAGPMSFLYSVVYLRRLKTRNQTSMCLKSTTMQRLLLVAMMIATKYVEDIVMRNVFW